MTANSRQVECAAAAWLARRDAGDWSDREQAALEAWLAQSTAHRVAFLRLEAAWSEAGRLKALGAGAPRQRVPGRGAWARSHYFGATGDDAPFAGRRGWVAARRLRKRRPLRVAVPAMAAVFVAATMVAAWLWRVDANVDRGAWHTALGARQVVHLADGSVATLGSDTELRAALSRRERDLDLVRGEAFFDVARDHTRPFVVRANGYHVIAVGTRFDVRRRPDGLRVIVTRGLVRLQPASGSMRAATELPAGSVALVDGGIVTVRHVALARAEEYLSWRNGYVVFHGTPLDEATREFNRYNRRKIVIADPSLDRLRVGGNFRLDNSQAFVRLMQQVFPIRVERQGDRMVLSGRGPANHPD
jgi:transmembrane sensor